MQTIEEFRESYLNEEINASAVNDSRYPIEVFIDSCVDILENDYSLITGMHHCYFSLSKGTRAFKSMRIDAADLDFSSNTLNLLLADYNAGSMKNLTNDIISSKSSLMLNFIENVFKGYFDEGELSDPAIQLAMDLKKNINEVARIHLFVISTDRLSSNVKKLPNISIEVLERVIPVVVDVLDMEKIYKSRLANFEKEDLIIKCSDFGFKGIPCLKAEIETDQYDSYLAIVPGDFLSNIYRAFGSELLESNVRSFLKFNGAVNKGIRDTILNEKSRFFTYNNGISTTASSIEIEEENGLSLIKSFTNLQIINGGQTTATLAATSIKNNADLSGIYVQMKLTTLNREDPELIRNIARFANSQNQVKTADLNSSHPYYVKIEDFSRKIYAPLSSGEVVQKLWFFERARGQYEQPLMQMTKKQSVDYKLVRPRSMKFTLTDLAKYENSANMYPHYVSWGGQVNARHFHDFMVKQWNKDSTVFDEYYYKIIIGEKILFEHIGEVISSQEWYQDKRAYRPQLVTYTFSKLAYEAKNEGLEIDYLKIWNYQKVNECLDRDIALIARIVFNVLYDERRSVANIETYSKKEECWKIVKKQEYKLSESSKGALIDNSNLNVQMIQMRKNNTISEDKLTEFSIMDKGAQYWENLSNASIDYTQAEKNALSNATSYCYLLIQNISEEDIKILNEIIERN